MSHKTNSSIDIFLERNAADIPPANRAAIRESAAKAIRDDSAAIRVDHVPVHLRDQFRHIVSEEAYRRRSNGKFFDPKMPVMPCVGTIK